MLERIHNSLKPHGKKSAFGILKLGEESGDEYSAITLVILVLGKSSLIYITHLYPSSPVAYVFLIPHLFKNPLMELTI